MELIFLNTSGYFSTNLLLQTLLKSGICHIVIPSNISGLNIHRISFVHDEKFAFSC